MTDIVVSAHNEASTIGPVIWAARSAPSAGQIIVVADNCADRTVQAAESAGATAMLVGHYGDKGSAMAAGLELVRSDAVCFLDSDISGLTPGHVQALLHLPPSDGQVVGVRDNAGQLTRHLPSISGERRLPAKVARSANLRRAGWAAETRLNVAVERAGLPWAHYVMVGVTNPARPALGKYLAIAAQYMLWSPELGRYLTHSEGSLRRAAASV